MKIYALQNGQIIIVKNIETIGKIVYAEDKYCFLIGIIGNEAAYYEKCETKEEAEIKRVELLYLIQQEN